jgi:PleD family two-component response regulator
MRYEHYLWSNHLSTSAMRGKFGIYTTCIEVAKRIRSRNSTTEVQIIFPYAFNGQRFWIFGTDYYDLKTARKSFNRILRELSYTELKKNTQNNEYESIMGVNSRVKNEGEVANAK